MKTIIIILWKPLLYTYIWEIINEKHYNWIVYIFKQNFIIETYLSKEGLTYFRIKPGIFKLNQSLQRF